VFVQAADVGLTGRELPKDTTANPQILAIMEEIRIEAAVMMGLVSSPEKASPAVPKVAFVARPQDYTTISGVPVAATECDLLARTKALAVMHKAYAVTGGICVSAAALIEGTVVHELVGERAKTTGIVRVGHPSGISAFVIALSRKPTGEFELTRSAIAGTSRRIMDGYVYVPHKIFHPRQ
jgi:hypothetical protein